MTEEQIPDLAQTLDEVWDILARHLMRHGGPRRFVTLASVDAAGAPRQRMVALRAADRARGALDMHTDALSHKVGEIRANSAVSVLAWAPEPRVQLRLCGHAVIETGAALKTLWQGLPDESRLNYSHLPAPGTEIAAQDAYVQRPDFARFARIVIRVETIDHVSLAESGHRRALFRRADAWAGHWVSP